MYTVESVDILKTVIPLKVDFFTDNWCQAKYFKIISNPFYVVSRNLCPA